MKDYLLRFLVERGSQLQKQVLKMVITLLAKLVKISWLEHPMLQTVVQELISLVNTHKLIALTAINDLIVEMSLKLKNLSESR